MNLLDYIKLHYNGNRSGFALACGVSRTQVNEWLVKNFVVIDNELYSKRRDLPKVEVR